MHEASETVLKSRMYYHTKIVDTKTLGFLNWSSLNRKHVIWGVLLCMADGEHLFVKHDSQA